MLLRCENASLEWGTTSVGCRLLKLLNCCEPCNYKERPVINIANRISLRKNKTSYVIGTPFGRSSQELGWCSLFRIVYVKFCFLNPHRDRNLIQVYAQIFARIHFIWFLDRIPCLFSVFLCLSKICLFWVVEGLPICWGKIFSSHVLLWSSSVMFRRWIIEVNQGNISLISPTKKRASLRMYIIPDRIYSNNNVNICMIRSILHSHKILKKNMHEQYILGDCICFDVHVGYSRAVCCVPQVDNHFDISPNIYGLIVAIK